MNILEIKKISNMVYAIDERCSDTMINAMYLVLGSKRAALIDTGLGLTGDLDSFVDRYTNLPVTVLSTHGHPDHIGANSLFHDIYMSKKDDDLIPWALSRKSRLGDLPVMTNGNRDLCEYAEQHAVGENRFEYKDIRDGDTFDLGDTVLEAIAVPGHTKGSMCFINRKDLYCFTGDAVTPFPWMWLDHSTSLSVYLASLKNYKKEIQPGLSLYCGHSIASLPVTIVDDLIFGVEEILSDKTKGDKIFKVPYEIDVHHMNVMQHDYNDAHIIYNAFKI